MTTIEYLTNKKVVRGEKLFLINNGRNDELMVAAADIEEACQVYRAHRGLPIVKVEKIRDFVAMFAV